MILSAFLKPFAVSLAVSVFMFFIIKIVITYLDDFLGKGLPALDLMRLFFYALVAIIPECIPLAVLMGSIMSFGAMAEHYELAALKSAGHSLWKIFQPAILLMCGIAIGTFLFNNYILPKVHLKFTSLLYDIRQKKPSISIKEGIYYTGIKNYRIRVASKSKNQDTLHAISIYDHTAQQGNTTQLFSKRGFMQATADTSALILRLQNGVRYEQNGPFGAFAYRQPNTLQILDFKQLTVFIPLDEFKMKRTNEALFKHHGEMLNIWQIDSMVAVLDSGLQTKYHWIKQQHALKWQPGISTQHIFNTRSISKKRLSEAQQFTRQAITQLEAQEAFVKAQNDERLEYKTEWHKKTVMSLMCLVLFFIGAPLGALIQKGGFGLPVVIAVLLFLVYFICTEFFMGLALEGVISPWPGLWLPFVFFLPLSLILTQRAARDIRGFDFRFRFIRSKHATTHHHS